MKPYEPPTNNKERFKEWLGVLVISLFASAIMVIVVKFLLGEL